MELTFSVLDKKTLFEQIWSKKFNCELKMKFGTMTNLNMQNAMIMFTFSIFDHKYIFFGKTGPKIQNC